MMKPGDCVRVGRNTTCEVVVRCPNISSLHCEVEIKPQPVLPVPRREPIQCSVRDLSSNGTWLLPKRDLDEVSKARKLSKGISEDLHLGDHILLLAPFHSSSKQFRFTLVKGLIPSEYVLKQLPESDHPAKMDTSDSKPSQVTTNRKRPNGLLMGISDDLTSAGTNWKSSTAATTSTSNSLKPIIRKYSLESSSNHSSACTLSEVSPISYEGRKSVISGSLKSLGSLVAGDKRKLEDGAEVQGAKGKNAEIKKLKLSSKETSTFSVRMATAEPAMRCTLLKPTLKREVSMGRCPICLKLFPVTELPIHSAACQERREERDVAIMPEATGSEGQRCIVPEATGSEGKRNMVVAEVSPTDAILEQCPTCLKIFPLSEIVTHSESCYSDKKGKTKLGSASGSKGDKDVIVVSADEDVVLVSDTSDDEEEVKLISVSRLIPKSHKPAAKGSPTLEQCPMCLNIMPVLELVAHSQTCRGEIAMEQCPKCLKVLSVMELFAHYGTCDGEMEQCPKCLKMYRLDELIGHSELCMVPSSSSACSSRAAESLPGSSKEATTAASLGANPGTIRHKLMVKQLRESGIDFCRFCESTSNTRRLAIGNICGDPDCQERATIVCDKTLSCGHACCGVKGEKKCLPCLHGCAVGDSRLKQDADDMCMICYTESLSCAPSIQLECGHVFHYHCCRNALMARWTGPRISFKFMFCFICVNAAITHPKLSDVVEPIRELYDDVKRKSLLRLEYEKQTKCKAITTSSSEFYQKPLEYAMSKYAYYVCYKCKKAYYGGEAHCAEAVAGSIDYNPAELVCPVCSNVNESIQVCPKHGTDFLEYKCRYCCSVAIFFCFGSTHFCNTCHSSYGRFNRKKRLPQCPVGPGSNPLKRRTECPLRMKHPPTGEEFVLGCGACRNAQTF